MEEMKPLLPKIQGCRREYIAARGAPTRVTTEKLPRQDSAYSETDSSAACSGQTPRNGLNISKRSLKLNHLMIITDDIVFFLQYADVNFSKERVEGLLGVVTKDYDCCVSAEGPEKV